MVLPVHFGCQKNGALSNMARKQTPGILTHQRETLRSCRNDTFGQEVKRKIATPLGMRSAEWEGGEQLNYDKSGGGEMGTVTSGDQGKKNGMMSFFTGTITEMKSGHTQWSCSMPGAVSVRRDYFVVMLVRKGLRPC